MNILVDIGHPGHVHLYKNIIHKLETNGHKIYVTTQNVEIIKLLLEKEKIDYSITVNKSDNLLGKALKLLHITQKLVTVIKKNKIDITLGSTPSLVQASFFARIPSVFMDDDDDAVEPFVIRWAHPFASVILSPQGTVRKSKKTVYYSGYHELAYLHPRVFTPDNTILNNLGLKQNEPFSILRFVALKGHHDIKARGLSLEQKLELISILEKKGKVIITGERNLEEPLKKYSYKLPPDKLHDLLSFAHLFIGDSQTMASEAAVLGVPSLRCNTFVGKITYLEDEEQNYGLTFGFTPDNFEELKYKLIEILEDPDSLVKWQKKREKLLQNKIDVTAFMIWFIENYPESAKIMKENPEYQDRFK